MILFAFLSKRWQHLPRRLGDLLAEYVGQHTLIITIQSGVTDTHISIYINKWNRVWIQMLCHKVWMMSDVNCTTSVGEHECVSDRQATVQRIVTQNKSDNTTQQFCRRLLVYPTTLIASVWGCSFSFDICLCLLCVKKIGKVPLSVDLNKYIKIFVFKGQELIHK